MSARMNRLLSMVAIVLVAACARPPTPTSVDQFSPCSPIAGLDDPDLPADTRTTVREAQEDFCAVLANRQPVHAKNVPPPSGTKKRGTTYYAGRGYRLVMYRDAFEVGGAFLGYYGPVLQFDSSANVPGPGQLSQVRVVRLPTVH